MNNSNISTILFDLGRVLVELDGPPIKSRWLKDPVSEQESWLRWSRSACVRAFESGELSASVFGAQLVEEQGLAISPEQFLVEFTAWPKGLFPGSSQLLATLARSFQLAYFSNTSVLHVPRLNREMGLEQYFSHRFASCEIGYFKPDPKGFEYILKVLKVAPENVLFLDDSPANVAAARSCGLVAESVIGLAEVKRALAKHSLI